jgi:uroporphyrinogen decarboxylase
MTPRERFAAALDRRPLEGLVPTFELVFFLTMEEFGRVQPSHRDYRQWDQMTERERELHRRDMAGLFVATAQRFGHSAIFLHPNPKDRTEELIRLAEIVREISGDTYFVMATGDATWAIPPGDEMEAFCWRLADDPQGLKDEAARRVDAALERAAAVRRADVLDGWALCADYCFNTGPFLSPALFAEHVTPFLTRLIAGYREMGFYTIKHTDGNIMPILDQLVQTAPHALNSLDPQGGVDIAEVKRLAGGRVCLIGNVNCGKMDTGTDDEVIASTRYALHHGMPGGGYIFSTSNCIYTGMRLARYELMLKIWREEGNYRKK